MWQDPTIHKYSNCVPGTSYTGGDEAFDPGGEIVGWEMCGVARKKVGLGGATERPSEQVRLGGSD